MSFTRALAPFRRAHFARPRNTNPFTIFERDPFFAGIAPLLNSELSAFQRYNFPRVQLKEGPKGYRLEAEVPGFRKSDLSIDFPDPRTLRLTGKRHIRTPDAEEGAGSETPSESSNTVESNAGQSNEPNETVEASTSDTAVTETGNKAVEASEAREDVIESEFEEEVSFTRQLTLPEGVDLKAVKASLDHGILSVVLPKLKVDVAQKVVIE